MRSVLVEDEATRQAADAVSEAVWGGTGAAALDRNEFRAVAYLGD